jgi:hypothetical protein
MPMRMFFVSFYRTRISSLQTQIGNQMKRGKLQNLIAVA